jgi:hypothetical protein
MKSSQTCILSISEGKDRKDRIEAMFEVLVETAKLTKDINPQI